MAQFPEIVPPEVTISANYLGADAQTIEQSVATPIEQQMSGVDNMNYMQSVNANNGSMGLRVNFDVKTEPNIDQVLTQLRAVAGRDATARRREQLRRQRAEVLESAPDDDCA